MKIIITYLICNIIAAAVIIILWCEENMFRTMEGIERIAWFVILITGSIIILIILNFIAYAINNELKNQES